MLLTPALAISPSVQMGIMLRVVNWTTFDLLNGFFCDFRGAQIDLGESHHRLGQPLGLAAYGQTVASFEIQNAHQNGLRNH